VPDEKTAFKAALVLILILSGLLIYNFLTVRDFRGKYNSCADECNNKLDLMKYTCGGNTFGDEIKLNSSIIINIGD